MAKLRNKQLEHILTNPFYGDLVISGSLAVKEWNTSKTPVEINVTGSVGDIFLIRHRGDLKFSITDDGLLRLTNITGSAPTVMEGAIMYSGSVFYFGIDC